MDFVYGICLGVGYGFWEVWVDVLMLYWSYKIFRGKLEIKRINKSNITCIIYTLNLYRFV